MKLCNVRPIFALFPLCCLVLSGWCTVSSIPTLSFWIEFLLFWMSDCMYCIECVSLYQMGSIRSVGHCCRKLLMHQGSWARQKILSTNNLVLKCAVCLCREWSSFLCVCCLPSWSATPSSFGCRSTSPKQVRNSQTYCHFCLFLYTMLTNETKQNNVNKMLFHWMWHCGTVIMAGNLSDSWCHGLIQTILVYPAFETFMLIWLHSDVLKVKQNRPT